MTPQAITWSQLIKELDNVKDIKDCQCHYDKYIAWHKLDRQDEEKMISLGRLVNDNNQSDKSGGEYPGSLNYWHPEAPIALAYYPYGNAEIKKCINCNRLFFVYLEFGGHAAEKRARLINKNLLVFDKPDNK